MNGIKPNNSTINTRRIAKNTLFMYFRMILILGITLFTSRVIINALGIDDYGIYNIIGGIVILFGFVNVSLKTSFQRFIAYELGRENPEDIHKIVSSCIWIVVLFALIVLVIGETIGLWFVANKLVIPENRHVAALWVYQFTIATFIVHLFQTPIHATIIAYEKLSFYSIYSIVEAIFKLLIAYAIYVSPIDKLILYSGLGFSVSCISYIIAYIYMCRELEVRPHLNIHKSIIKPIGAYAGWSMTNSSTVIIAQQGGNILLNLFYGVIANGAFGIANQVSAAIYGFVSNFQSAFNPQIVKSYAAAQLDSLFILVFKTSAYSFFLLFLICLPFFFEGNYIIGLWLGEVPEYSIGFCQLMLCYFLIDAPQAPLWMLIQATGKIRGYQIWSGIINILNIPIAYVLLTKGFSAYWIFIIRMSLNFLAALIRPWYLKTLVQAFSISAFYRESIFPIIKVIIISIVTILGINRLVVLPSIISIIITLIISVLTIWFIGINKSDRRYLLKHLLNKIH